MTEKTSTTAGDVPGLLAAFDSNALLRPRFDVPNIVDLSAAIFDWAGVPGLDIGENAKRIGATFADAGQLVFVVVDGLGMNFIDKLEPSSFLHQHLRMTLQTVFPSTTSAVFTSLATAAWPNRHSIIGWDMYLEEIDAVATIIRFERRRDGKPLGRLGVREHQAYPTSSLFGAIPGDLVSIVPDGIANTPYSDYWTGHKATYVTHENFAGGIDAAISGARTAENRRITYLYTADVDYAAHEYGTNAPQTMGALRRLNAEIERLAKGLPSTARIVLTADHGQLNGTAPRNRTDKSARRAPLTRALGRCARDALRREAGERGSVRGGISWELRGFCFPADGGRGRDAGASGAGTHRGCRAEAARYASGNIAWRGRVLVPVQVRFDEIHRVPLRPHAGRKCWYH